MYYSIIIRHRFACPTSATSYECYCTTLKILCCSFCKRQSGSLKYFFYFSVDEVCWFVHQNNSYHCGALVKCIESIEKLDGDLYSTCSVTSFWKYNLVLSSNYSGVCCNQYETHFDDTSSKSLWYINVAFYATAQVKFFCI